MLAKNALSVLLITTIFLSLCLHFVKFFCNLTSSVTTDGVVLPVMVQMSGPKCFLSLANKMLEQIRTDV